MDNNLEHRFTKRPSQTWRPVFSCLGRWAQMTLPLALLASTSWIMTLQSVLRSTTVAKLVLVINKSSEMVSPTLSVFFKKIPCPKKFCSKLLFLLQAWLLPCPPWLMERTSTREATSWVLLWSSLPECSQRKCEIWDLYTRQSTTSRVNENFLSITCCCQTSNSSEQLVIFFNV